MFWSLVSDASCPPEKSLLTKESSATAYDSNVPPLLILAAFRITRTVIDDDPCRFLLMSSFQEGGGGGRRFGSRILGEGQPGQIWFL